MEDLINERCGWAGTDPLYVRYHDEEWGRPVTDDNKLFEFLLLESAQAGLSWLTILRKREGYRQAFCAFVPERVAQMTTPDIDRLMHFDGIVKNRHSSRLFRSTTPEKQQPLPANRFKIPPNKPVPNPSQPSQLILGCSICGGGKDAHASPHPL